MHQSFHFWEKWPYGKEGNFRVPGTTESGNDPFTVEQMGMPFMLLAAGFAAAVIDFLAEVIVPKMEKRKTGTDIIS